MIVYDPQAVDFEVTGFADLWREEFRDNLALVAEWRNVIGMAQKKLGYSYNDTDPEHMAQVGEELLALKPNIAVMNDDTPHNALIYGDAIAGFMYGLPGDGRPGGHAPAGSGLPCRRAGVRHRLPGNAPGRSPRPGRLYLPQLPAGRRGERLYLQLINYGNCNTAAVDFMSPEYLANDTVRVRPSGGRRGDDEAPQRRGPGAV